MSRTSSTILDSRLVSQVSNSSDLIECSVHILPKPLLREFRHVFGENYLRDLDSMEHDQWEILAIPTNQQAREDLVAVGDPIEFEKDRLLNVVRTGKIIDSRVFSFRANWHLLGSFSLLILDKNCARKSERLGTGQVRVFTNEFIAYMFSS